MEVHVSIGHFPQVTSVKTSIFIMFYNKCRAYILTFGNKTIIKKNFEDMFNESN